MVALYAEAVEMTRVHGPEPHGGRSTVQVCGALWYAASATSLEAYEEALKIVAAPTVRASDYAWTLANTPTPSSGWSYARAEPMAREVSGAARQDADRYHPMVPLRLSLLGRASGLGKTRGGRR